MSATRVSVLVPTYNRARLLKRALLSVAAQSHENLEVIVSDNASDDETSEVLAEAVRWLPTLTAIRQPKNLGPILNWRACLEHCRGDYAVILSDDDALIGIDYLANAADLLDGSPQVKLVLTNCVCVYPAAALSTRLPKIEREDGKRFVRSFWRTRSIPIISNVFRVQEALAEDPFLDNDVLFADVELFLRLSCRGQVAYHQGIGAQYTFHGSNIISSLGEAKLIRNASFLLRVFEALDESNAAFKVSLTCRYLLFSRGFLSGEWSSSGIRQIAEDCGVDSRALRARYLVQSKSRRVRQNIARITFGVSRRLSD